MRVTILGCSGGIGGDNRSTALLADQDILIDAGTGVSALSLEAMARIEHIFITHTHIDHIACLPLLLDSVGPERDHPVTVYASDDTIAILQNHLFNWKLWPDFSILPSPEQPFMRYRPIRIGETITLGSRRITAIPANHTVPAVGYHLDSGQGSLVFSGDTTVCPERWHTVNKISNLRHIIIETAFAEAERHIAIAAKHLCPSLLAEDLAQLNIPAELWITHLKPVGQETLIEEIKALPLDREIRFLQQGNVLEF